MLTIYMRMDVEENKLNMFLFQESERIARQFTNVFSNIYSERKLHFFKLAIYLSLKRKNNGLFISEQDNEYTQQGFYYDKIKNLLSSYQLNEDKIVYINMMQRLLNKSVTNYQYLIMDHYSFRKSSLKNILELEGLVCRFEQVFDRELLKYIFF